MVEDALSFWTEIQRYEDMLVADGKSLCFAPLSELYRKLGLLEDAVSVAEKGCALHPDYPVGFLALGNACYAKGMTAEARDALERVVALKPDHIQALKLLGQLYVELGEIALARKVLGQVLEQDPDDLECTLLINSVASTAQQAEPEEEIIEDLEVIEDLEEVVEEPAVLEAEAPGAVQPEGVRRPVPPQISPEEDEEFWAIEDLEEPEILEPEPTARPQGAAPDPLTTATLAELYVSQGFLDKAIAIYAELLQAHPENQQYRLRRCEIEEMRDLQYSVTSEAAASTPKTPAAQAAAPSFGPAGVSGAAHAEPALLEKEEPFAMEAPIAVDAPLAAELFAAEEIPATSDAFAAMELPAAFETAALEAEAAAEAVAAPAAAPACEGDAEAELKHWLENIRRRRDGV